MTYGQVFLLAASVNQSARPAHLPPDEPEDAAASAVAEPPVVPTRWEQRDDLLTAENGWVALTAELKAGFGVRSLRLVPADRDILGESTGVSWLRLAKEGGRLESLSLQGFRAARVAQAAEFELQYAAGDGSARHGVVLQVHVADQGEIRLTPRLTNASADAWKVAISYPHIDGCRIAPSIDDAWYLLGARSLVLDHRPVTIELPYSGTCPLQIMDLFARRAGGGLGIYLADAGLLAKTFRIRQDAGGTELSVHFGQVEVPAGGQVALPTAVLVPHAGDWHQAYQRYRSWVRGVGGARESGRLSGVFYCRRDYPLGGTGYLFDAREQRYQPETLIRESISGFGGIDMIDISGWAYNEQVGRVGEYLTNDLGGLAELRRAIDVSHRHGVRLGLYFEGYLVDRRSSLGRRTMPAGQLIGRDGKPMWWPRSDKEFFVCPAVAPWRDALSAVIVNAPRRRVRRNEAGTWNESSGMMQRGSGRCHVKARSPSWPIGKMPVR